VSRLRSYQAAVARRACRSLAGCRRTGAHAARRGAGDDKPRSGRVAELFVYDNFSRVPVEQAEAGDICALTGLADVSIGETICAREAPNPLPMIKARCCLRELWRVERGAQPAAHYQGAARPDGAVRRAGARRPV